MGAARAVTGNTPQKRIRRYRFRLRAPEKRLIVPTCGIYGNVVRFLSPLAAEDKIFSECLDTLEAGPRACSA
jgi:4-aminobutyrate aminotransferase